MSVKKGLSTFAMAAMTLCVCGFLSAEDIKRTEVYKRIRAELDAVRAIDTHDHLRPFDEIPGRDATEQGRGMTLRSVWAGSYFTWIHPLAAWPEGATFDVWWAKAKPNFADARATSFYRYLLPAFQDLYGVDFETMSDEEARRLNDRIFANYQSDKWLEQVVVERANIELMLIDPYWARFKFERPYRFGVPVLNVTTIVDGYHESSFASQMDSPYHFARESGQEIKSLDEYLATLDAIFQKAVASDAVCLKTTLAYLRTLQFENVPRERAEKAFGRPKMELSLAEIKDFQDFIMWRLCELSAKYGLPFQIHTGQARIQGSNPMLLVDMIAANPRTKFVLFHGGFP